MTVRLCLLLSVLAVPVLAAPSAVPKVEVPAQFEMPFVASDAGEAVAWQEGVRSRLLGIVERQNPRQGHPLAVEVGAYMERDGYREAELTFAGNEQTRASCTVTVPKGSGPFPAVVCLHGHGGDRQKVHDAGSIYKGLGKEFARRGFVTLTPSLWHCVYAPNQLWNLMRLVDVLSGMAEVDAGRIGVAGLSMGGEWTMWLTVCDPRVKAAVVSGWMCTTEGVLRVPNCVCWMPPGLLELCDIAEVHILAAPRPLLLESASEDNCFPIDAARAGFEKIRKGYAVLGAADAVRQHEFPGGHAWNGGQAYAFMVKALQAGEK